LNQINLFLNLMFSLNKNLFFEKFTFLKSKSEKRNTLGYAVWFIIKSHILPFVCIFLLCKLLNHEGFSLGLLIILMLTKLIRIDNIDWKLYFRNDFCLAFPNSIIRFQVVLLGNLVKSLLFEEITPIYILLFTLFTPLNPIEAIIVYVTFVILFTFFLIYYYLLEIGSIRIKKIYSFFSYLFSMISTFLITYGFLNIIISLVENIDLYTLKENPSQVMDSFKVEIVNILDNILNIGILSRKYLWGTLVVSCLITLLSILYVIFANRDKSEVYEKNTLLLTKFLEKNSNWLCKDSITASFFMKEVKLFNHLYRYNFKQYYHIVFFDRSMAIAGAFWLALYQNTFPNNGLIFFCISIILMSLDISSQIGVKMIANVSFIADFNTLRIINSNGFDLKFLVKSKKLFFYIIRLFPMLLSSLIMCVCFLKLEAPLYTVFLMILVLFSIIVLYPSVYWANNLISTKMDYKHFEKYLEESKILDFGVDDFLPISITYKLKVTLLLASAIACVLLPDVNLLYIAITIIMIAIGITDYLIMRRISSNILLSVQGGDYSANIKKIFRKQAD